MPRRRNRAEDRNDDRDVDEQAPPAIVEPVEQADGDDIDEEVEEEDPGDERVSLRDFHQALRVIDNLKEEVRTLSLAAVRKDTHNEDKTVNGLDAAMKAFKEAEALAERADGYAPSTWAEPKQTQVLTAARPEAQAWQHMYNTLAVLSRAATSSNLDVEELVDVMLAVRDAGYWFMTYRMSLLGLARSMGDDVSKNYDTLVRGKVGLLPRDREVLTTAVQMATRQSANGGGGGNQRNRTRGGRGRNGRGPGNYGYNNRGYGNNNNNNYNRAPNSGARQE